MSTKKNDQAIVDAIATTRIDPFLLEEVEQVFPDRGNKTSLRVDATVFTPILNELANCGVMRTACMAGNVSLGHVKRLRKVHPEIEQLVQDALEFYQERICQTIHNRAIEGWEEPVFYQGREVGHVTKFSDRLLEMQARRHIKAYNRATEVDVNVSGGILVVHQPAKSREDWLAEHKQKQLSAPQGELPPAAENVVQAE